MTASPEELMRRAGGRTEHYGQGPNAKVKDKESRLPLQSYTLAELQCTEIKPMTWIVPEYFPEGLTVLAGKPKIGKSWLMLAVALAVARGTEVLGQFIDKGGDVLYGAFEDGKRRM